MPGRDFCAKGGGLGLFKIYYNVHEMKVLKMDIDSACLTKWSYISTSNQEISTVPP